MKVKPFKGSFFALANTAGALVADRDGVLLWKRKRDVPENDAERAVRVDVTVVESRRSS